MLKEALTVAQVKKPRGQCRRSRRPLPGEGRGHVLGVARFNLVEQMRGGSRSRGRYRRADDEAVLIVIRAITEVRPTYGFRRVTAILNRTRRATGEPALNHMA